MKVLIGSNSKTSINRKVAQYLETNEGFNFDYINLFDEDIPFYNAQLEDESGIPQKIKHLHEEISNISDQLIIFTPEYNGDMPGYLKNIFDWLSRVDRKIFNCDVKIICVTPGKSAGKSVRDITRVSMKIFGATNVYDLGVGNFYNIYIDNKIVDEEVRSELFEFINKK